VQCDDDDDDDDDSSYVEYAVLEDMQTVVVEQEACILLSFVGELVG